MSIGLKQALSAMFTISRGHPRGIMALAAVGIILLICHWRTQPAELFPQTLQGWDLQQPDGVAYLGSNSQFTSAIAAAEDNPKLLGPTTRASMKILPPFEPTCIATSLKRMETWGCPVIMCNKDPSCTVDNTTCCAYLNLKMLSFLHDFLASKCLQDEYLVMFGTGLGAVRNQTIIPWTEDVDVGITPLALQFLELNSTREELWRYGYALWHHQAKPFPGYWKICPHQHHPSPHFQAAMVRGRVSWSKTLMREMAVYTDMWPMWPVDESVEDCRTRSGINTTAILATPWDDRVRASVAVPSINPCSYHRAAAADDAEGGSQALQKWCILYAAEPFYSSPKPRKEVIGTRLFPTATDQERILPTVYGPGWRTPDPPNHGTWPYIADGFTVVDALTEKLSLGAWGGMPYKERRRRCKKVWQHKP